MSKSRITIFNTPIDAITMQETIALIDNAIKERKPIHHVVVNVAKLVNMQKDKALFDSVVNWQYSIGANFLADGGIA